MANLLAMCKKNKQNETTEGKQERNRVDWGRLVRIALIVGLFLSFFSLQIVPSESMSPTLQVKDMVLYKKTKQVERGDVVLFKYPSNPRVKYVKRVIAVAGDVVELYNGEVFVNDESINEPYIQEGWHGDVEAFLVPADSIYVLGDNRNNSEDSRYFGLVDQELIVGKATFVLLPFKRVQMVE